MNAYNFNSFEEAEQYWENYEASKVYDKTKALGATIAEWVIGKVGDMATSGGRCDCWNNIQAANNYNLSATEKTYPTGIFYVFHDGSKMYWNQFNNRFSIKG